MEGHDGADLEPKPAREADEVQVGSPIVDHGRRPLDDPPPDLEDDALDAGGREGHERSREGLRASHLAREGDRVDWESHENRRTLVGPVRPELGEVVLRGEIAVGSARGGPGAVEAGGRAAGHGGFEGKEGWGSAESG